MRTARTLKNLASINKKALEVFEPFLQAAEKELTTHDVTVEVISGLRSMKEQADLYALGRSRPGKIVTKAPPGSSWHNFGLAIDLGLFKNGKYLDASNPRLADSLYAILGNLAKEHKVEWAGNWKSFPENPHFQVTFGLTLSQARERLQKVNSDIQKLI